MRKILILLLTLIPSLFLYSQDSWQQKASMPGAPRFAAVAFVIGGKGYVGTGEDDYGSLLKDFWQYDAYADSWIRIADFPGIGRRYAAAFSINGKGYVGTGFDGANRLSDFYSYDTVSNTWSAIADLGNGLAAGRYGSVGFAMNSHGYVVTGYDGTGLNSRETWMYSDSDLSWHVKDNFDSVRPPPWYDTIYIARRWATGFAIGNTGFVSTGHQYNHYLKSDTWKYQESQNKWMITDSFPGQTRAVAISFSIGSTAFLGTGYNNRYLYDFFKYDIANNSWSQVLDCSCGGTSDAVGFSINGKGYLCTGRNEVHSKNELWEYTPDTLAGLAENTLPGAFTIYPNPAHNSFTISMDKEAKNWNWELEIYDMTGRGVYEQAIRNQKSEIINCQLSAGVYLIKVQSGAEMMTEKLVLE